MFYIVNKIMSEAIKIYEALEKVSKDSNFKFGVDEEKNTYIFDLIGELKLSREDYIAMAKGIKEDWPFDNAIGILDSDVPQKFLSDHKGLILTIGIQNHRLADQISVSRFLISRKYEKAKDLADYVIEAFQSHRNS